MKESTTVQVLCVLMVPSTKVCSNICHLNPQKFLHSSSAVNHHTLKCPPTSPWPYRDAHSPSESWTPWEPSARREVWAHLPAPWKRSVADQPSAAYAPPENYARRSE